MGSHIDEIILYMGYSDSSYLKYESDFATLNAHTNKVLNELSPYAVYIVDGNPFVLFFDEMSDQETHKLLNKKIWNAQIPVAIFCGTNTVKIYNGCTIDKKSFLLTEIDALPVQSIDENSPFSFWEITNQNFWVTYENQFNGEKLNNALLNNLTYLTEEIRNVYHLPFATKLVLRLIFIRYLIDRGVDLDYNEFSSDVESSKTALLNLLNNKQNLYGLFSHLKNKFNGNLFELGNEIENENLTDDVFHLLFDFLSGSMDSVSKQLSLFHLYDFNIIPVELISNIYEILLGKEAREKDNAFYTPQYLVDYILDATIEPYIENNGSCKVLDPSCGSGVFLVNSYRRMVEKSLNGELFTDNDTLLRDILVDNIYGVDLNPDAIDVAIFSLYLAVLDYKNPRTLNCFQLPNLKEKNLFSCDFFDDATLTPLHRVSFDFIVGNPPWGSQKGLHVDYCEARGYKKYLQNNDTCRSFVFRSKDFCNENTQCCFVLHSKMLYMQKQPSKNFREFLLTNTKITRIIELSSVRKLVFKNADAPAVVLAYGFSEENTLDNCFEYVSMKPNVFFKLFNIVVVEKNDMKYVKQRLLKENDWAWKTLVYGLTGDIDVISKLKDSYPTLLKAIDEQVPNLIKGVGIQYNNSENKDSSHLIGLSLLDSNKGIDHFSIDLNNLTTFNKQMIRRTSNKLLFQAPYCLLMRGLDMKDYTMRSVYSEASFIYKEAVFGIKGSFDQKLVLLNITGLFNSSIYSYFNLMLGSSLGVEREQRQVTEVLSFPYVYSDEIANQVEAIQQIKSPDTEMFSVQEDVSNEVYLLNQAILAAFNLSDDEFVDYALKIQIPQLTGENDNHIYRKSEEQDFETYGQYFYEYLSSVFSKSNKHIKINVYPQVAKHYSVFEVVVQDEFEKNWLQFSDNSSNEKSILAMLSSHKINDMFYCLKDVFYFDESSFYIIKPNHYKNWHPAIAKLDLMEMVDLILSRNGGTN